MRSSGTTPASDLYSLGCVLFEMLTGRIPFEGKTTVLLVKHINDPPPLPSSLAPGLPRGIDRLVMRLLKKKAEDRYRDAYHLVEDLQRLLDTLPSNASSRPNANSPTTGNVRIRIELPEAEEEGWSRTARLYRRLIDEAHGHEPAPDWLAQAIAAIDRAVAEVRSLRTQLEENAATEEQEGQRRPRGPADRPRARRTGQGRQPPGWSGHRAARAARAGRDTARRGHARGADRHRRDQGAAHGEVIWTRTNASSRSCSARRASSRRMPRELVSGLRTRLTRKQAERRDLRLPNRAAQG